MPNAKAPGAAVDPLVFWDDYYKKNDEPPSALFRTLAELIQEKAPGAAEAAPTNAAEAAEARKLRDRNFAHAEAALKGYLRHHGKQAEPWMYEWLVKAIEWRKGTEPEVKTALAFAALLAKRTQNPNDLVRIADMMVVRNFLGAIGGPKYETSVAELIDLAAEKVPANAIPPMMSIDLAGKIKDPKRMGDAAERLLALGWLKFDDGIRRNVAEQVGLLVKALKEAGRAEEAEALAARLAASQARDVYVALTWAGEADLDLAVDEPLGVTANYQNQRTVFGGALLKNGFGSHPEEVYVCPRGFDGDYTVRVEAIFNDSAKPVTEAKLVVITHEGAQDEKRREFIINVEKPNPVVVRLTGGRRKEVLPFIAPPQPPASVEKPKDKAKAKEAPKVAVPPR